MFSHLPANIRRILIGVGAVVMTLIVFVGIPAAVSSHPSFFARYPEAEAKYATWLSSTHSAANCRDCHSGSSLVSKATYSGGLVAAFYTSIVSDSGSPDVLQKPDNAACTHCHFELRTVSPKGDLRIPHRAHVDVLKMKCVDCHAYLVHESSAEGRNTPPMGGCLKCHNGDTADGNCAACHTKKAIPRSHRAGDWLVVHSKRQQSEDCAGCHAWVKDWCADCHSRRPRSHTRKWRAEHGHQVQEHRNCEACHQPGFCVRCHGKVPELNFDPRLKIAK